MGEKIQVMLVHPNNHEVELKSGEFEMKDGKIPLQAIKNLWGIGNKRLMWIDGDAEVGVDRQGYSDISFAFCPFVKLVVM